jgi:hypothetical protein
MQSGIHNESHSGLANLATYLVVKKHKSNTWRADGDEEKSVD